ncbi:DJ-1/PfpI family protein [Nonomuraea sp. SBT364]|uniref:DJ-1/PfpI family protein n=1 Tax=Nonomuraea sp. SBT364 TaxID=1580530 RepID=UPI00066A3558|nr:DJ-1/PfpI family protein [Nonomuraea sp. SBT364]
MATEKTIAFVLYPGCTILDLVGPLQVLSTLAAIRPEFRVVVVAERLEAAETDTPLRVQAGHTFGEVPAPDVLVVPGGEEATMRATADETLLAYVRGAAAGARTVASVCTGSFILGAAGLLEGRRATSHWAMLDALAEFGAVPTRERWVADGPVLTAAGVSAGIDMALHLAAELSGEQTARAVQFGLEYDPEPPLGALDWDRAPRAAYAVVTRRWVREALGATPLAERLIARLGDDG